MPTALSPPPGGDERRGNAIIVAKQLLTWPSLVLVILRFYTRIFISKCIGWDDWTILLATVDTSTPPAGLNP